MTVCCGWSLKEVGWLVNNSSEIEQFLYETYSLRNILFVRWVQKFTCLRVRHVREDLEGTEDITRVDDSVIGEGYSARVAEEGGESC